MNKLSECQQKTLDFISQFIETHSFPPTVREVGTFFNISVKAAHDRIRALTVKGYLNPSSNKSRAIGLTEKSVQQEGDFSVREIPLLGTVTAGLPIMADQNFDGNYPLPSSFFKASSHYFALKVRGDSMINAGIYDGDIAVIEQTSHAENGQIVVALIDDESITLKRFFKETNRVRLQPENDAYNPIFTQNVRIAGVLATIIRTY